MRNAVGIDPDSKKIVCSYVKNGEAKGTNKSYLVTEEGLNNFITWVKELGDIIIGIEGSNGICKPIEKVLNSKRIVYYTLKPNEVDHFRKAVLGKNKNNEKDAESVARYAMALEAQGKLEKHKRVWFPNDNLQNLTRMHGKRTKELTMEVNGFWKVLKQVSPDLALALAGENPKVTIKENIIQQKGILNLFQGEPNIYEWKTMDAERYYLLMGGHYCGRNALIGNLRKVSKTFKPLSDADILIIKNTAKMILEYQAQLKEIENMIKKVSEGNRGIETLKSLQGIGILTASKVLAEIIDIRRFSNDDSLACYSGLGMRQYATGEKNKMVHDNYYNRRLKDALITAARNMVMHNPVSGIAKYHKSLIKKGKKPMEAYKRVARALVRVFFKILQALVEDNKAIEELEERREGDMANGINRSGENHESNIPPSIIDYNVILSGVKLKAEKKEGKRRKELKKAS